MKCVHLLESGKCSYVSHFSSSKDFAVSADKRCKRNDSIACKYYEEASNNGDGFDAMDVYDDYEKGYNEEAFEKIKKKKHFNE